jgi:hypothetical protein
LNKVELTEKELTAMKARALIAATLLAAAALVTVALPARAAWDHPHGDSANTGFAKVLTPRAVQPMQFVPVGELSSGAGPVTAPDGTVYVGNVFGQLLAFDANGTPAWSRQLPSGQWITSSPVLGADGSVYVVSETRGLIEGSNSDFFYESTLHKFTPGGDLLFQAPFPQHSGIFSTGRGDANAAPNIWRSNGRDVVLALALYDFEWRLVAFSSDGQVLGETVVTKIQDGTITTVPFCDQGGFFVDILCGRIGQFHGRPPDPLPCTNFSLCLPSDTDGPPPGIAVWQNPLGGTPSVVVTDGFLDTVGYTFDPAKGFVETFRVHDINRTRASAPVILPDGHTVVGTVDELVSKLYVVAYQGHVTFAGPNPAPLSDIGVGRLFRVDAAPTRLANGSIVVVERSATGEAGGRMSVLALQGNQSQSIENRLGSESIASAAASCTYFYVATAGAFITFDQRTLRPVASVPWSGGGRSSPAIGPGGHVYAVAGGTMFVFPPSQAVTTVGTACAPDETGGGGLFAPKPD